MRNPLTNERARGGKQPIGQERNPNPLSVIWSAARHLEKARVATQIRQTHLGNTDRQDLYTNQILSILADAEGQVDGLMAGVIQQHPAWPWLSQIKGIGKENIATAIADVDIAKAHHVSNLWSFLGFGVVDGKATRPVKGQRLPYSKEGRMLMWRVGSSLLKAGGNYYAVYVQERAKLEQAWSIRPTPTKGDKVEPEGVLWARHAHNRALRKMIKLFLSHLWAVWREAEGLPVTLPYAQSMEGHQGGYVDPWELVDKPGKRSKPAKKERASKGK